jgi:hypothetical protein
MAQRRYAVAEAREVSPALSRKLQGRSANRNPQDSDCEVRGCVRQSICGLRA